MEDLKRYKAALKEAKRIINGWQTSDQAKHAAFRSINAKLGIVEIPYIYRSETVTHRLYNPLYGDDRMCTCGHLYLHHFDTHDNMTPTSCKYCGCGEFKERLVAHLLSE